MIRVITGPTGSGKSKWAEDHEEGLLFNADPFQFYREIPILSNQPEYRDRYRFVADRSLFEPTSAGSFSKEAEPYLQDGNVWVGFGLYLGALIYGLDDDRRKGTPFQGSPRHPFSMIVLDPARDRLYQELDCRVDSMIERGAISEAEALFPRASEIRVKAIGLTHLFEFLSGRVTKDRAIELWKRDTRRLAKRQWTWLRKFAPPSANCRWIQGEFSKAR